MSRQPPPPYYDAGDFRAHDQMGLDISPLLEELESGDAGSSTELHNHINPYFRITKVVHMTPRTDVESDQNDHPLPTAKPNVTVGQTYMQPPPPKKATRKRPAADVSLECEEAFQDPPISDMFESAPRATVQWTGYSLTDLFGMGLGEALKGNLRV